MPHRVVSVLELGIGITRGQYYWILDIGWFAWYRSHPVSYFMLHFHCSESKSAVIDNA